MSSVKGLMLVSIAVGNYLPKEEADKIDRDGAIADIPIDRGPTAVDLRATKDHRLGLI